MRYLIVALVVSLCWLHQDWLIWPLLSEVQREHDLMLGIPAGLGYQVALSFGTAAVWFFAVWKAWPTELERWAGVGSNRRGGGSRRGGRGRSSRGESPRKSNTGNEGREAREGRESNGGEGRSRRSRGGRGRRRGGYSGHSGHSNGGQSQSSSNPAKS